MFVWLIVTRHRRWYLPHCREVCFLTINAFMSDPDSLVLLVCVSCIWHLSLIMQQASVPSSQRWYRGSCVSCSALCSKTNIQKSFKGLIRNAKARLSTQWRIAVFTQEHVYCKWKDEMYPVREKKTQGEVKTFKGNWATNISACRIKR